MFNADAEPVERAQVIKNIDRLLQLLPRNNVLHRFHSLRPLTETSDAPVIAFIMDVGLRAESAQEAYTLLRTLCQLSVTQTVSMNLRTSFSDPPWPITSRLSSPSCRTNEAGQLYQCVLYECILYGVDVE